MLNRQVPNLLDIYPMILEDPPMDHEDYPKMLDPYLALPKLRQTNPGLLLQKVSLLSTNHKKQNPKSRRSFGYSNTF
jgi:hypothetical protein